MMQSEFEELIGGHIGSEDYRVVEFVYMYHPAIHEVKGKQQIADIYKIGGMAVIKGMVEIAKVGKTNEEKIIRLQKEVEELKKQREALKSGSWTVNLLDYRGVCNDER